MERCASPAASRRSSAAITRALTISFEETLGIYRRIVAQQAERVDLMLCETMASAEEARAAAIAASESGKPVWVSWTLADDGPPRLRSGETLATAAARARGHRARRAARQLQPAGGRRRRTARSASHSAARSAPTPTRFTAVDTLKHGGTVDVLGAPRGSRCPSATPTSRCGWAEAGAAIVGGCCETGPEHIAALRDRLHAAGIVTTAA